MSKTAGIKNVSYGEALEGAFKKCFSHLNIFWTSIVAGILFLLIFIVLIGIEVGILFLLLGLSSSFDFSQLGQLDSLSTGKLAALILIVSAFIIADIVLLVLLRSYMGALLFGMYKDATLKNKCFVRDGLNYASKNYMRLFYLFILLFLLVFVIPLGIIGAFAGLLYLITPLAALIALIFLIPYVILLIIFSIGVFFLIPIFTLEDKLSSWQLIKNALTFTKNNLGFVLLTWLISAGFGVAVMILRVILEMPARLIIATGSLSTILFVSVPLFIVSTLLIMFFAIFISLFQFHCYYKAVGKI